MVKDTVHYIKKGLISQSDYDFLAELDTSKTKKYLAFIIKSYLSGANLDLLRNRITEYDTLVSCNQVDRKDIYSFKTFEHLDEYVQQHNNIKSTWESKRETKKEAEIILDADDIFIVSPYSHAASCLYGAGTRWCTTMENEVHFERYFYGRLVTFYYVQVRSDKVKQSLKQSAWKILPLQPNNAIENLWKVAVSVYPDGKLEVCDAADHFIGHNADAEQSMRVHYLFEALGVDRSLFVPKAIEERLDDAWHYRKYDTTLDLSGMGITRIPDSIGKNMFQLESLILSENKIHVLPESIGQLCNLKTLYVFHNQLTSLPESLATMNGLRWLGLTGNNIPGRVIRELKKRLPNTRIYI